MWSVAKWYTQFGLMAGSVFREVLRDLELEGLHEDAAMVRGEAPARVKWKLFRMQLSFLHIQSVCRRSCDSIP